ncbi:MAG: hypothetical protein AAGE80_09385 [Pseudomonadota bacterium]
MLVLWQAFPAIDADLTELAKTGFFGLATVIMLFSMYSLITFVRKENPSKLHFNGLLASMIMSIVVVGLGILSTYVTSVTNPQVNVVVDLSPKDFGRHGAASVMVQGKELLRTTQDEEVTGVSAALEDKHLITVDLVKIDRHLDRLGNTMQALNAQITDLKNAIKAQDEAKKAARSNAIQDTAPEELLLEESGI